MRTLLCNLQGCDVWQEAPEPGHSFGKVWFIADADIDADGANGQTRKNGKPQFAYGPGDSGLDLLRNAGYPNGGFQDILVCSNGQPLDFGGGYCSRTAYRRPGQTNPQKAYLDACAVSFMVIEGFIRKRCKGIALGAQARITDTRTGRSFPSMVGDIGPLYKLGEISIAGADGIGIDSNARTGGESRMVIKYEFWPGVPAIVNGETFELIPAHA